MNLLCEICLASSRVVFYQNEPYISIANWNINKTNKIKVNSSTYNNRLLIIWLSKDSSVRWNTSEMKTDVEIERNHKKKCRGKVETKNVTKASVLQGYMTCQSREGEKKGKYSDLELK